MAIPLDTRQIHSRAIQQPATGPGTGFADNLFSAFDQFRRENLSTSEGDQWNQEWQQQFELAKKHGVATVQHFSAGADPGAVDWMLKNPGRMLPEYWHEQREQQFAELKQRFPDAGFKTNIEMFEGMTQRLAKERGTAAGVRARATGAGAFGAFVGDMGGAVSEPVVALTLPFGAASGATILRAALTEAALASATEAAIQPQIAKFRAAIGNPQAEGEAMRNILLAGGGAGALVATLKAIPLGYRALADQYRKEIDAGRVKPTVQERAALDLLERHAAESDLNPYNRGLEGSTEAHAANLRKADIAAAEGTVVPPKDLEAPAGANVLERRSNPAKRQQVEDLQARVADLKAKVARGEATPEEIVKAMDDLDRALHTSEKAPALQNERAFNNLLRDKPDSPVLFFDLDNFKRVNDENTHAAGDQVIAAVGDLAKEVADELGLPVFHKSGDEFLGTGGDVKALNNLGEAVQKRLANANIEIELPDGTLKTITEVRLSFGVASGKTAKDSVNAAEQALKLDKQRRKAAGLRTDRPDGLSGGQPGRENPQNRVSQNPLNRPVSRGTPEDIEAQVKESDAGLNAEVKALLDENPDLKVPGSSTVDESGNVVTGSVTAAKLLEDAAEETRLAKEFEACVVGPFGSEAAA